MTGNIKTMLLTLSGAIPSRLNEEAEEGFLVVFAEGYCCCLDADFVQNDAGHR